MPVPANTGAARRALADLTAPRPGRRVPAYDVALVHLGLGEIDQTLAWLERAFDERSYRLVYLAVDPVFDPLHHHPQFESLLSRIGLVPIEPDGSAPR